MTRFLLLLSCWLLATSAHAASFDCQQASQAIEQRICANERISLQDERLGQRYQQLLALSQDSDELRQQQRQWLQQRNQCQADDCLRQQYQQRLQQLDQQYQRQRYRDQPMSVSSVKEETWNNGAALVIRTTVPVDADKNWRRFLQVKQTDEPQPADHWILSEDGLKLIYPFVEPATDYLIEIKPGLSAINNERIVRPGKHDLTTRRTQPSAAFSGGGHVLSSAVRQALPVTTLNVDAVDIRIHRLDDEQLAGWSRWSFDSSERYYRLDEFAKHNPEVFAGRFDIEHQRNQRTTRNIDLSEIDAVQQPGAYLAVMQIAGRYDDDYQINFFTVSDIGVQLRKNAQQLRVNTHSIASGEVLTDVTVSLYGDGTLVAEQPVDKNGEAVFADYHSEGNTLIARRGEHMTVLRYDRQGLDLSAYDNAVSRHSELQAFAWSPRDLYRRGERLEFNALLRDADGQAVDALPLEAKLIDPTGNRVAKATLQRQDAGHYVFNHTLSDSAKTGPWTLHLATSAKPNNVLASYEVKVEDFQPERLELKLFDGDHQARRMTDAGGELSIPVSSQYLYGAPASGNRVDGFVIAELDRKPLADWSSFVFGLDGETIPHRRLTLQPTDLDSNGEANLKASLQHWQKLQSPLALIANVSVYESGGRPITRKATITHWGSDELVGLEPQFKQRPDNRSLVRFKAILADRSGELHSGDDYQLRLIREDRNYYWRYSDSEGWRWQYEPLELVEYSQNLEFNDDAPIDLALPVEYGDYRVEIYNDDNQLVNRYRFRTRWSGWRSSGDSLKPDQVQLAFEQQSYQPGDTATLLMTPATDGLAHITVETNDGVLWRGQREVKASGERIEIPTQSSWKRHDIYVTATVFTPGDMKHSVAPKRAFGFAHLPLRRADAGLNVSLQVKDKITPRQPTKVTVNLADAEQHDDVWVRIAAVDVGVLNITRFNTPDPLGYLFGPRRYDYQLFDVYDRIIENAGFDYAAQRFGGGLVQSEAELVRGGEEPKNEVKIIAWQTEPVRLSDAQTEIELDIPDFNGRLRLMAVAWNEHSVGSAEAQTTVADPLVMQLSRPRFLALGDQSQLSLDVANLSGQSQTVDVTFSVGGMLKSQSWSRQLSLSDEQREVLTFPVLAQELGRGTIEASLSANDGEQTLTLEQQWALHSRAAYPALTERRQTVLEPGQSWDNDLTVEGMIASTVQAQLTLDSSPPIDTRGHFDSLLRYPYGCTEQTTSSGYPWALVTPDAARRFELSKMLEQRFKQPYTDGLRRQQLERAIKRLQPRQTSSGGFSLWSNGDARNWLSVYVGDFLTDAREAGATLPGGMLEDLQKHLQQYVRNQTQLYSYRDDQHYGLATRAYAAYVLARSNKASLANLRRLQQEMEAEAKELKSGLPWAHLARAMQLSGDANAAATLFERAKTISYKPGYYGDYGSAVRDQALTFALLAAGGFDTAEPLLALFDEVQKRRWLSTQERNALFRASLALDENDQPLRSLIQLSDMEQNIDQEQAFRSLLNADQVSRLQRVTAQEQRQYLTLELIAHPVVAPEPVRRGMAIERRYYNLDGDVITPERLATGELVVVELVTNTKDLYVRDALVVDLLPAGLELENQNLANASVDLSKLMIRDQPLDGWQQRARVEHVEFRDDRFVAALPIDNYGRRYLYYLARAVTPGKYSVPTPFVEDMYRPYQHGIGETLPELVITP